MKKTTTSNLKNATDLRINRNRASVANMTLYLFLLILLRSWLEILEISLKIKFQRENNLGARLNPILDFLSFLLSCSKLPRLDLFLNFLHFCSISQSNLRRNDDEEKKKAMTKKEDFVVVVAGLLSFLVFLRIMMVCLVKLLFARFFFCQDT